MLRKRFTQISLLLAGILAMFAAWTAYHHQYYKHFAVHQPGMVYRSAWLETDALRNVIEEHRIRSVINLCKPGELGKQRRVEERQAVSNAGARLIELPMPISVDPSDPLIARHLEVLLDPDNYPILVHCQHGVTRTAKHIAMYDIVFRGLTGKQSLNAQPLFGRDGHNDLVKTFVSNFEKEYKQLYPAVLAQKIGELSN